MNFHNRLRRLEADLPAPPGRRCLTDEQVVESINRLLRHGLMGEDADRWNGLVTAWNENPCRETARAMYALLRVKLRQQAERQRRATP